MEPESAAAEQDPLLRNGLVSPLCKREATQLSSAAISDCRSSGFIAAPAPSEDYSFDTHIDTGIFGINVDALIQDYLIRPPWMALVWLVHWVLIALQWCYELNLFDGPVGGQIARALQAGEASFTRPWLPAALAFAAILLAYHGLVRRRYAQTLGEAVAMLAMIAAAMAVIADPAATVGVISHWAAQASVGTFGAASTGSTARPYAALAGGMEQLYAASIDEPWCYMEFGDVRWCKSPRWLDPRLRKAALRIAGELESEARKEPGGGQAKVDRAQLLRKARTNGDIFLALPPNGALRNSINEEGSLLYVLCGGAESVTECDGPTAAQAEFRTQLGTMPRIGGLIVIAIGVLGMLVLLGFIALRLLEAAVISLLLLLLTPAAALAPALGESGRAVFQRWGTRLLGAICAKLVWSLAFGVVFAATRMVLTLEPLGWLVQWMLMGALWWCTFFYRHKLLAIVTDRGGRGRTFGAWRERYVESALAAGTLAAGRGGFKRWRDWRRHKQGLPPELPKPKRHQHEPVHRHEHIHEHEHRRKKKDADVEGPEGFENGDRAGNTGAGSGNADGSGGGDQDDSGGPPETGSGSRAECTAEHTAEHSSQSARRRAAASDRDREPPSPTNRGASGRAGTAGAARSAGGRGTAGGAPGGGISGGAHLAANGGAETRGRPPRGSQGTDLGRRPSDASGTPRVSGALRGWDAPGVPTAPHGRGAARRSHAPDASSAARSVDMGRTSTTRGASGTGRTSGRSSASGRTLDPGALNATDMRAAPAPGATGTQRSPDARTMRAGIDRELQGRREGAGRGSGRSASGEHWRNASERLLHDAREVARQRQRQLGWSWRAEGAEDEDL